MDAYISSIGTAVPDHHFPQSVIGKFMLQHLPLDDEGRKNLQIIYRASGIQYRQSVIPDFDQQPANFQFFPPSEDLEPFPGLKQRMKLYEIEAIKLCEQASRDCLGDLPIGEITHLITVSCTGMYAPGIDIELVEKLGLNTDVERTAINFMGCYGSFNGLKMANHIVQNNPDHKVLLVSVELCSIHLQQKTDADSMLSGALFGDGAAAVLIEGKQPQPQLEIKSTYCDLALSGKDEMAWHISDFGFEMKLSVDVPDVIQSGIRTLTQKLLAKIGLSLSEVEHFAIHPGGKRILQVIETELGLTKAQNEEAYEVLKTHGNMSSVTVLFVLKRIMDRLGAKDHEKHLLSFAFGPGLTMESMLYQISMK